MGEYTDWQVDTSRISVFPEDNVRTSPSRIWDQFIGEEPDSVQFEQSRLNARQKKYGNRTIALVKQQAQIDWQFPIVPDKSTSQQGLPNWGSLPDEVNAILEFAKKWLICTEIMPVNRLAFGATLLTPTVDEATAYEKLQMLFPSIDPENVSDFSYQINRRRSSKTTKGLKINRLSRWNIATLERTVSTLDPIADIGENRPDRLYSVRVELDINTGSNIGYTLPSESLVANFEELVDMGLEIAREGDIS